jgi:CheY-like chemotaxis protein
MAVRILLLEDDVASARNIQKALAGIGCMVEILRDGNTGLARAVSDHFDLIIAAVELPGMNGFRLCNRFKKDGGHTVPFFLISEQPSPDVFEAHRKLATRAEGYFNKPLTVSELVAQVKATVPSLDGGALPEPPSPPGAVLPKPPSPPGSSLPKPPIRRGASAPKPAPVAMSVDDAWLIDAPSVPPTDEEIIDDLLITDAGDAEVQRVADEISKNETESSTIELLRKTVAEHEETNVRLLREVAEARAATEKAIAAKAEAVLRHHRELEQQRVRVSMGPRPVGDAPSAKEQLAHRELLVKKEAEVGALKKELAASVQAASELKRKIETLELERANLGQAVEEEKKHETQLEKQLAAARADKDQATRRAEDLARRFERVRPEIEQAELALAAERSAREAEAISQGRALAELAAQKASDKAKAERQRSEELAAKDAEHTREITRQRSEYEDRITKLTQELTELAAKHDGMVKSATKTERDLREELAGHLATARAEHVEALGTAQRGFEHDRLVLRHELEAENAKLKTLAKQKIGAVQAELGERTREVERLREAKGRLEDELHRERGRNEDLVGSFAAERDALTEQGERAVRAELERARDEHDVEVRRLREQIDDARSQGARELAALQASFEQAKDELEARAREAAARHERGRLDMSRGFEEQLLALGREHEQALVVREGEHRKLAGELEAEVERRQRAENAVSAAEDRRARELAEAERVRQAERAEAEASLRSAALDYEAKVAELRLMLAHELSESGRAHDAALAAAREQSRAEALAEAETRVGAEAARSLSELRAELEAARDGALSRLERVTEEAAGERSAMERRLHEQEQTFARAREELETERQTLLADAREAQSLIAGLEALVDSRMEDVERLGRDLDEARTEAPALEAEIAALRTELTSMRLKLDSQALTSEAAQRRIEHDEALLAKAKEALTKALARVRHLERGGAASGGSADGEPS